MPYMQSFVSKLLSRTLLTDEEKGAILILRGKQEMVQRDKEFVCGESDDSTTCLIASGLCGRTSGSPSGKRQITAFYMSGDIPDLQRTVLPEHTSRFIAVTTCSVVRIRHAEIRQLSLKHPGIAEAFWRETACEGSISAEWVANLGRRDAKSRIAHLFCELAVRFGSASGNSFAFNFPVTQSCLGEAMGLSSVHVNRSMQALKRDGLMQMQNKTVEIFDWAELRQIAEFDSDYLYCKAPVRLHPMN